MGGDEGGDGWGQRNPHRGAPPNGEHHDDHSVDHRNPRDQRIGTDDGREERRYRCGLVRCRTTTSRTGPSQRRLGNRSRSFAEFAYARPFRAPLTTAMLRDPPASTLSWAAGCRSVQEGRDIGCRVADFTFCRFCLLPLPLPLRGRRRRAAPRCIGSCGPCPERGSHDTRRAGTDQGAGAAPRPAHRCGSHACRRAEVGTGGLGRLSDGRTDTRPPCLRRPLTPSCHGRPGCVISIV